MIDRVPFLPEAVLVCFDTLNVRASFANQWLVSYFFYRMTSVCCRPRRLRQRPPLPFQTCNFPFL